MNSPRLTKGNIRKAAHIVFAGVAILTGAIFGGGFIAADVYAMLVSVVIGVCYLLWHIWMMEVTNEY